MLYVISEKLHIVKSGKIVRTAVRVVQRKQKHCYYERYSHACYGYISELHLYRHAYHRNDYELVYNDQLFPCKFFPVADRYHSGDKQTHERVHIHKSVVRPVCVRPAVRNMKKRSRKAVRKYYDEHDSRRDGKCCQEAANL